MNTILISAVLAGAALLPAAPAGSMPKNFLVYEKAAAKEDKDPETSWVVDRKKNAALMVNPCDKAKLGTAGRVGARTIIYTAVPDFQKTEQVVLYDSAASAERALADLRLALRTCASVKSPGSTYRFSGKAVDLGDDALTVTGQVYQGRQPAVGGERTVVARRGSAVMVYGQSGEWGRPASTDFRQQTSDATKMIAKICQVATCG